MEGGSAGASASASASASAPSSDPPAAASSAGASPPSPSPAGAYLVVRIKGQADVPHWASTTLRLLRLDKKYRATIVPAKENTLGMLNKVKHYVSWREADAEIARELLDKRGLGPGRARLTSEGLRGAGFSGYGELAEALASGRASMASLSKANLLKPWFALSPPRHGFRRSTKRMYGQRGVLGRNEDLPDLVRRMI